MSGSFRNTPVWILEDSSSYIERQATARSQESNPVAIRLYRLLQDVLELMGEVQYVPQREGVRSRKHKTELAIRLIDDAEIRKGIVVAGSRLVQAGLLESLVSRGLDFVVALPSAWLDRPFHHQVPGHPENLKARLLAAAWKPVAIRAPESAARFEVALLGKVSIGNVRGLQSFALNSGGVVDYQRGVLVGMTSLSSDFTLAECAELLGWARWLRFATRRARKSEQGQRRRLRAAGRVTVTDQPQQAVLSLTPRVNLRTSRQQDERAADGSALSLFDTNLALQRRLLSSNSHLNVVELFAGAGGMGLGFLKARDLKNPYRIVYSGEVNPTFVATLSHNHDYLRRNRLTPTDAIPDRVAPVDLRTSSAMHRIQRIVAEAGGADVLIGGPPCQGFSNANRNSWSSDNPNNRLVDTYLDYVDRLQPKVLIMENVQGIVWTQRHDSRANLSVADHVVSRLARAGYQIFPKMLDAAWYGVPQHRSRFFLIAIHRDLGYSQEDFGPWGPFPRPTHGPGTTASYVTVCEAIGDLPKIDNGDELEEMPYSARTASAFARMMREWAPEGVIWDHVTSCHAEYVIERYKRIPQGANWSAITDMMTNYSAVERTHSNIYRRLSWREPSITIGHYRKAMLIHPEQHRGLSLREAARLQSFPDWYRFAGSPESVAGGLTHKQQQLANAVCPLVTRAVADFLLKL